MCLFWRIHSRNLSELYFVFCILVYFLLSLPLLGATCPFYAEPTSMLQPSNDGVTTLLLCYGSVSLPGMVGNVWMLFFLFLSHSRQDFVPYVILVSVCELRYFVHWSPRGTVFQDVDGHFFKRDFLFYKSRKCDKDMFFSVFSFGYLGRNIYLCSDAGNRLIINNYLRFCDTT